MSMVEGLRNVEAEVGLRRFGPDPKNQSFVKRTMEQEIQQLIADIALTARLTLSMSQRWLPSITSAH